MAVEIFKRQQGAKVPRRLRRPAGLRLARTRSTDGLRGRNPEVGSSGPVFDIRANAAGVGAVVRRRAWAPRVASAGAGFQAAARGRFGVGWVGSPASGWGRRRVAPYPRRIADFGWIRTLSMRLIGSGSSSGDSATSDRSFRVVSSPLDERRSTYAGRSCATSAEPAPLLPRKSPSSRLYARDSPDDHGLATAGPACQRPPIEAWAVLAAGPPHSPTRHRERAPRVATAGGDRPSGS